MPTRTCSKCKSIVDSTCGLCLGSPVCCHCKLLSGYLEPATTPATAREQAPERVREQLAALCHEQWSGWMRYLFDRTITVGDDCEEIQTEDVRRWTKQMAMPYADLPENEKESDRKEADRILALLAQRVVTPAAGDLVSREDAAKEVESLLGTQSFVASVWSGLEATRQELKMLAGRIRALPAHKEKR